MKGKRIMPVLDMGLTKESIQQAIYHCEQLGLKCLVPTLIKLHNSTDDELTRLRALSAIGRIGGKPARRFLLGLLQSSTPKDITWVLVNALNQPDTQSLDDAKVLAELFEVTNTSNDVKVACINGLASRLSWLILGGETSIEKDIYLLATSIGTAAVNNGHQDIANAGKELMGFTGHFDVVATENDTHAK